MSRAAASSLATPGARNFSHQGISILLQLLSRLPLLFSCLQICLSLPPQEGFCLIPQLSQSLIRGSAHTGHNVDNATGRVMSCANRSQPTYPVIHGCNLPSAVLCPAQNPSQTPCR